MRPMKTWQWKRQPEGIHAFDRESGMHVLYDELADPNVPGTPNLLQLALSSYCPLDCAYCYRPVTEDYYSFEDFQDLFAWAEDHGFMEITFGGGEPLAYPRFAELLQWAWEHTNIGYNFTTSANLLDAKMLDAVEGHYGQVRVSLNSRGELKRPAVPEMLKEINWGANHILRLSQLDATKDVIDFAAEHGARDFLFLRWKDVPRVTAEEVLDTKTIIDLVRYAQRQMEIYIDVCYDPLLSGLLPYLFGGNCVERHSMVSLDSAGYAGHCSFVNQDAKAFVGREWEKLLSVPYFGCPYDYQPEFDAAMVGEVNAKA